MKVILRRVRVVGTHFLYIRTVQQQRARRKSTARFQNDGHGRRSTACCRGNTGRIAEYYPRCLHPDAQRDLYAIQKFYSFLTVCLSVFSAPPALVGEQQPETDQNTVIIAAAVGGVVVVILVVVLVILVARCYSK